MKFNININQAVLSGTALDMSDCAILDYLQVYCNSKSERVEKNRKEGWTWVDYGAMIDDMPLLRIRSKGAITPRIKRIADEGFIMAKIVNQKMYVLPTSKMDSLFLSVHETERIRSPKRTEEAVSVHETEPTIILSNQGTKPEWDLPEWLDKESWAEWEQHRREIKKKLTPLSVKKQIAFLDKYRPSHKRIIARSIEKGWTGFYELPADSGPQAYNPKGTASEDALRFVEKMKAEKEEQRARDDAAVHNESLRKVSEMSKGLAGKFGVK